MVTMISQDLSQFDLHARAILGLPIPNIAFHGPSASKAIKVAGNSDAVSFDMLEKVLAEENTNMRIFGKKELRGHRRLGVLLARDESVEKALAKVERMAKSLKIEL